MKSTKLVLVSFGFIFTALLFIKCDKDDSLTMDEASYEIKKADPTTEGNNLSFPVIWSDGFEKTLREPPVPGEVLIDGEWSYVWAEDPAEPGDPVYSCKPHSENSSLCEDGSVPGDGSSTVYMAFLQKTANNICYRLVLKISS